MAQVDWYGGLEPELDGAMIPSRPEDPDMRESASIWLFEENGAFAFPRIGIEAVGATWENHRYDCNFALGQGRIMRESTIGPTLPASGGVLGAGGLRFRCVEPFRKWEISFDGAPYEATVQDQLHGRFGVFAGQAPTAELPGYQRKPLRFRTELTMAAPAWTQDYRPTALEKMTEAERVDAGLMGYGWRVEQLFRGEGELTVDGETRAFRCLGSRIHRQSVRPMGAFRGHCWQSALFPDGRAFATIAYPPREDGSTYNNGYYYDGREWLAARSVAPPFLRRLMAQGDDVSLTLETDRGSVRIGGETLLSTFHIGNPGVNGMNNQQGTVRYTLDGMTTYGMIERSSPAAFCTLVE
ncbi:MAG: hypothetical protein WCY11_05985 [Novosphingobium sp.]